MDPANRQVIKIPLTDLFDAQGRVEATRGVDLDAAAIAQHLRAGAPIVLARIGAPLEWLRGDEFVACWKSELKPRLWAPDRDHIELEDFPDDRAWRATAWHLNDGSDVIVFEEHH